MNAQSEGPGQRSNTPKTPSSLPRLSSTTKDILARVRGPFPDANSTFSPSYTHGNIADAVSSTPNSSATGSNLNLLYAASALPSLNANKFSGEASRTRNDFYPESHNHQAKAQISTPFTLKSQSLADLQLDSKKSTINVGSTHNNQGSIMPVPGLTHTTQSSSRRQREYVLQDGTIVQSGKGLGRGRPGIKRGPRKPKLNPTSSTPSATNVPAASSAPIKKRKRSILIEDDERGKPGISVSDDEHSDSYTPKATHTRSGRSTQKPSAFVPTESPTSKKTRQDTGTPSAHGKNLLIKKKIYRGREQNALCERCLRGRGPVDNAIVFCDGCNLCWHQKCHDPMIPKELVLDTKAEWFCKDCLSKLESTAAGAEVSPELRNEEPVTTAVRNTDQVAPSSSRQSVLPMNTTARAALPTAFPGLVGARSLTVDQRQQYLTSLSQQQLIDLLLYVSNSAPHLPLFPAPAPKSTARMFSSTLSTFTDHARIIDANPLPPTAAGLSAGLSTTTNTMKPPPPPVSQPAPPNTSPNPNLNPSRAAKAAAPKYNSPSSPSSESAEDSEPEEDYEEEDYTPSHAKCYPKPGHGVMAILPPDKADEHMLLEGPESRTFSHSLARVLPVH